MSSTTESTPAHPNTAQSADTVTESGSSSAPSTKAGQDVDGSNATGDNKRKADHAAGAGADADAPKGEEGGKDLVEKKQTTLDDVVQHEKKETESAGAGAEEGEDGKEAEAEKKEDTEPPAKKAKTDPAPTEVKDKQHQDDTKDMEEVRASTPPSQRSQTAESERPHKSVKRAENIADKHVEATPSKSAIKTAVGASAAGAGAGADSTPASSSPLKPSHGNGNGSDISKGAAVAAPNSGNGENDTVPGDEAHLDHPENWTTGGDPATDKQKGFLKVLEKQKGVPVGDVSNIGKSEASEKIDELKNM